MPSENGPPEAGQAVSKGIRALRAGQKGISSSSFLSKPLGPPPPLERAGADPAVASSVFVTMVTDSMGFLVFLGLAASAGLVG